MKIKVIYLDDIKNAKALGEIISKFNSDVEIEQLTNQTLIDNAVDVLVVYLESNMHSSLQIDNLLDSYFIGGKRVIGVHSVLKEHNKNPKSLDKIADAIVCWDEVLIRRAISGESIFVDAECKESKKKVISRHNC
ncbi:hypothetical protein ACG91D_06225 [Acinetobacter guillouiae]|uniref:hypothetical protein n=1 Tax=Acinetobacter guillouiae TaxID=106649 RepID=UPI003AF93CB9